MKYCNSLTAFSRFQTREVMVGNLGFGGNNPIRVQSMTTANTMDTLATVEESIRMIEAGCELVRITAPSKKEAENLKNIKEELLKRGYSTPIVADIHFTPNAAEIAAKIVEKVRINPGNYADKKKFEEIEYTDKSYQEELDRIREKFIPLVKICKEHKTAMRIGTNHGSLSDRILSRYGDTPKGMVESAMEFLRICRDENYHEIILSMKASNTRVMVQAYRLLVYEMMKENMNYPLHLGVTEAGEGEDGRIKSAVGLGDGIFIYAPKCSSDQKINSLGFGILQATRTRISKTEYISCPSCGRTLFDLQETTAKIRKVTDHLKGVKIGIMGCIVNGPGEMADADYGYVGTRPGKITLYKEKNIVMKNIDEEEAVDALIGLIKEHGDWVEK